MNKLSGGDDDERSRTATVGDDPRARPLHSFISIELRRRIVSGELQAGARLPTEAQLMAEFGVARGTVRQALAALRSDGAVAGSRGAPPVVQGERLAQPFSELLSFSAWIASLGKRPGGRVVELSRRRADAEAAANLGIEEGDPICRLVRVRTADGEPLMIERATFPTDIGELVAGIDLDQSSIYAELAAHGIVFATARQLIDAVAAPRPDARFLSIPPRTPLLRVRRRSLSPAGRPLEWSEDRYIADRVSLAIETAAPRASIVRNLAPGLPTEPED